jgi:hypothetical protein
MAGQREDYLLREIARLRALVAALAGARSPGDAEQALELAIGLQAKLFPLPVPDFLALDAAGQFERLCRGLPGPEAAEKVQTYAELLFHTATLYDDRDRPDLALGARQLALHMALLAALELGDTAGDGMVVLLRRSLAGEDLHAPVRGLWEEFERSRG